MIGEKLGSSGPAIAAKSPRRFRSVVAGSHIRLRSVRRPYQSLDPIGRVDRHMLERIFRMGHLAPVHFPGTHVERGEKFDPPDEFTRLIVGWPVELIPGKNTQVVTPYCSDLPRDRHTTTQVQPCTARGAQTRKMLIGRTVEPALVRLHQTRMRS